MGYQGYAVPPPPPLDARAGGNRVGLLVLGFLAGIAFCVAVLCLLLKLAPRTSADVHQEPVVEDHSPVLTENVWGGDLGVSYSIMQDAYKNVRGLSCPAVVGFVTNRADHSMKQVILDFNLYDSAGALVGNADSRIDNLGSHEIWKFSADGGPIAVSTAKLITAQAR